MPDQPERVRQALEHVCPRCKAPPGIGCTRPTGSHLASHTVHKAREEAADRVREDTSPPPELTTNYGRSIWRHGVATLRDRGDVTPHNLRILLSAVRWTEEHAAALERASATPECIGSTGQAVANPQFKVASTAQERAIGAYRTLLLTPDTRVATAAGGQGGADQGDDLDDLDRQAAGARAG